MKVYEMIMKVRFVYDFFSFEVYIILYLSSKLYKQNIENGNWHAFNFEHYGIDS